MQGRQREEGDRADCLRSHRFFDILNHLNLKNWRRRRRGERMAELPSYPRRCLGVGLVVPPPLHTPLRPVRWGGVREDGSGLRDATARLRMGGPLQDLLMGTRESRPLPRIFTRRSAAAAVILFIYLHTISTQESLLGNISAK